MFFHTHLYHATKMNSSLNNLEVIGSVLPDFALTTLISWDALHKKKDIAAFSTYAQSVSPAYASLVTGVHYHNTLDVFSHVRFQGGTGYAYEKITPELITLLMEAFSTDEKRARGKGHNFIECGVEMRVLRGNPNLPALLKDNLASADHAALASLLAPFYQKTVQEMQTGLEGYFSLMTRYDLQSEDGWVLLWDEISKLQFGRSADKEKVREGLRLALALTEDSYKDFLAAAIAAVGTEAEDAN